MSRQIASVKALTKLKDVTPELAQKARTLWDNHQTLRTMERINDLLGYHGVEVLGIHKRTNYTIYMLQASDLYDATILFYGADHMRVESPAYLVERNLLWDVNDENRPNWPY
jgi:hypothetical protein